MRKTFAQILEQDQKAAKAKIEAKLPHWSKMELEYPGKLCMEQCSSEQTALYKADILSRRAPAPLPRIADLTAGLGVDSWAFAQKAVALFYNERNIELREAVERNFSKLGIANAQFHSFDICPEDSTWIKALQQFRPDWIFLDPARRGLGGQKVFRPEDCQPDITVLLPILREITPNIMVKLSPMADISLLQQSLGDKLREIIIIQAAGEVKELLCLFDSSSYPEPTLTVVSGKEEWSFLKSEEASSPMRLINSISEGYLIEPSASVLKAGAFRLCCERFNLSKLASSTHLYFSVERPVNSSFLKVFTIVEVLPFNKSNMAALGKKYPHAEVCARNIPLSSESLAGRMGIKAGNPHGIHIFGCTCGQQKVLVVTKK